MVTRRSPIRRRRVHTSTHLRLHSAGLLFLLLALVGALGFQTASLSRASAQAQAGGPGRSGEAYQGSKGAVPGAPAANSSDVPSPARPVAVFGKDGPADPLSAVRPVLRDPTAPAEITEGNWTNLFPRLYSVSAASTTEAWALGEGQGALLHFTAGSWNVVTPTNLSGLSLNRIKMLSPTDGWLVARGQTGSKVFQFDGTNWNDMSTGLGTTLSVGNISVLSDTNIWANGSSCTAVAPGAPDTVATRGTPDATCAGTILHWNGTTWTQTGPTLPTGTYLYGIAMTGPSDGWVAGVQSSGGSTSVVTYRYDGTTWNQVPAPTDTVSVRDIASGAPGDAWLVVEDTTYYYQLYHYSGGTWTRTPTPDNSSPWGVLAVSATDAWAATSGSVLHWDGTQWNVDYSGRSLVAVTALPGQVWAVGEAETIVSKTGTGSWVLQKGGPTTESLEAVATVSTNEAWAVGGNGTFLHYNSGTWTQVSTAITDTVWNIQMLSATDGYAVGSNLIAHWDGTTWTRVASPTGSLAGMYGLYMFGQGEGWAVGSAGRIWKCTAGVWSEFRFGHDFTLFGVSMDSPDHGWAVGGYGTAALFEYTGGEWVNVSSTLPPGVPGLGDVVAMSRNEAWATVKWGTSYSQPALLHYLNGTWTLVPGVTSQGLYRLALDALGEVWAVGYTDYHYSAGTWSSAAIPATWYPLSGISLVPGRGGWVVGPFGEILQYDPLSDGRTFFDVPPDNPFSTFINYLASHNIISGYSDNTFRPGNNTTRGQLSKIVALAENWTLVTPQTPTFSDVPTTNAFYAYIETAYSHQVISGYADGTFRPGNNVTRGQLSKIVVLAEGWTINTTGGPHFYDVPQGSAFYPYVETAFNHSIISGYADGSFRPGNNATRGQISKIVYNAITQP